MVQAAVPQILLATLVGPIPLLVEQQVQVALVLQRESV